MKSRKTPHGGAPVLRVWMFIASLTALVGQVGAVDQVLKPQDFKGITLGGNAEYGKVMATSGDWLAVGAPGQGVNQFRNPGEDPSFYEGGRVLLWKREAASGPWALKQVLTWPSTFYNDQRFGSRLAMAGNRLLVGDKGGTSGRIYAYALSDGVWVADGTLSLGGEAANGFTMSGAIALSGDFAAIGSPDAMVNGVKRGGVDLFQRQQQGGWVRVTRLVQPEPSADVRGMGIHVALNGSTVYASYSTNAPAFGGVLVFEKGPEFWGMRVLEGVPQVNHRGIGLQVSDGRLFVAMNSNSSDRRFLEYTLSQGSLEVLATEFQTPTRDGPWHVSGDRMAMLPVPSVPLVQVYRRQPPGWVLEESLDYYTSNLQGAPMALLMNGTEILLSGVKRPPMSGIYTHVLPETVQVLRRSPTTQLFGVAESLIPLAAERVRDGDFGRSVSASEPWLAVGAPCPSNAANRRAGVVHLYRRGSHGTYLHHSILQSPEQGTIPVPYLDSAHFGHLVSLSGNRLAVSLPLAVVIYEYNPFFDTWFKVATILPPLGGPTESFGASLALQGGRLAVGAPSLSSVYLYQIGAGGAVTAEATLQKSGEENQMFGHSLALDGDRLLIGAPHHTKASAFVYEKKSSTWTQTARFLDPTTLPAVVSAPSRFGRAVALSGNQALISSPAGGVPYTLTGTIWRAGKTLPGPDSSQEASIGVSISGNLAAFRQQGLPGLRLFELSAGLWKPLPQAFPFLSGTRVGLALQSGQIITRPAEYEPEVRVLDLNRPPTLSYDALLLTSGSNAQTVDAGEFVPAVKVDQFAKVTLHHQGIITTKVNIEVMDSEGEFTLKTNPVTLTPGQSKVLDLTFLPLTAGPKQLTLVFTPDTPGAAPQILVVQSQVHSQPTALQFTQQPAPVLSPLGSLVEIYATVTGTRPWTYRWLRNGLPVPGANAFYLPVKDPGLYQVQVTNPHGIAQTESVPVGFYGLKSPAYQAVLAGSTVRASVHATGPGVYVRWSQLKSVEVDGQSSMTYVPLTDGPQVAGSHTPNLTLRNFRESGADLMAEIFLPTRTGTDPLKAEVFCNIEVVTRPEFLISQQAPLFVGQGVGSSLYTEYLYYGGTTTGPFYRFSGLPPGLKSDVNGSIEGTPTTPGVFTVSGTVTIDGHTSPLATARIVVSKYPELYPGTYWAFTSTSADQLPQGGAVTLDLTPAGTYSGSLLIGLTRTPLAGGLTPIEIEPEVFIRRSKDFAIPLLREGKKQVALIMDTGYPTLGVYVREAGTEFDINTAELFATLEFIKPLIAPTPSPAALGRHNFGLFSRAGEGMGGPPGHGFGTLTVAADRRVTYAAQLADGTALTGSSWLGWAYTDGQLFFYQGDAKTRSILRGAVPLKGDDNSGHTRNLTWERLPLPGRLYPNGIPPVEVTLLTSRYPAPGGAAALPGTQHQVSLDALNLFVAPTPFQLTAQGRTLFGPANPLRMVLRVTPATGLYTGSFLLTDPIPPLGKPLTRAVAVKGILLPELESGPGYFLLPALPDPEADPPTTLSTSPITSGAIVLEAVDSVP